MGGVSLYGGQPAVTDCVLLIGCCRLLSIADCLLWLVACHQTNHLSVNALSLPSQVEANMRAVDGQGEEGEGGGGGGEKRKRKRGEGRGKGKDGGKRTKGDGGDGGKRQMGEGRDGGKRKGGSGGKDRREKGEKRGRKKAAA